MWQHVVISVLMAVKAMTVLFCFVTPYSLVGGYQCCGGIYQGLKIVAVHVTIHKTTTDNLVVYTISLQSVAQFEVETSKQNLTIHFHFTHLVQWMHENGITWFHTWKVQFAARHFVSWGCRFNSQLGWQFFLSQCWQRSKTLQLKKLKPRCGWNNTFSANTCTQITAMLLTSSPLISWCRKAWKDKAFFLLILVVMECFKQ